MNNPQKLTLKAERVLRGCHDCLFFDPDHKKCILGMKNCILNDPQMKLRDELLYSPKYNGCSACVYGKSRPCVSFCMKSVLKEWHARKLRPERRSVYMHLNHILKSLSGRSFSLFSGKTTVPVFCVPAF